MKSEQISVFLENRAGRLSEVVHALAEAQINIRALSLADTSDFGILRLVVCEQEKAKTVLKDKGFTLGCAAVVAVEIPDRPGGLDAVLQIVSKNGINVEYMYALARTGPESAVMIFRFDKADEAVDLLLAHGVPLVPNERLCS